ncbi:unnamed protein product [Cuscuta campestris]|uniref:Uncharacterized protein n=1 Tax=Cuscuta campestris TaxID=132261 RepID=A0A484KF15_9ASTE|nr:unnamed protein product [Cuscuta campestris]
MCFAEHRPTSKHLHPLFPRVASPAVAIVAIIFLSSLRAWVATDGKKEEQRFFDFEFEFFNKSRLVVVHMSIVRIKS